jgi:uncharacterized protein (DUF433 family)
MGVFPDVSMDAAIRFGKPRLTGTRVDVASVLAALASGNGADEVCGDFDLTMDQVRAALAYAARGAAHFPPAVTKAS